VHVVARLATITRPLSSLIARHPDVAVLLVRSARADVLLARTWKRSVKSVQDMKNFVFVGQVFDGPVRKNPSACRS